MRDPLYRLLAKSLEAALLAFPNAEDFREALLRAVNLSCNGSRRILTRSSNRRVWQAISARRLPARPPTAKSD
jgi:hypothetical protein